MNRTQAIKEAGKDVINLIDNGNPDFSNRVMDNSYIEFSTTANYINEFGDNATIQGCWYFTKEQVYNVSDLDELDWHLCDDFQVV